MSAGTLWVAGAAIVGGYILLFAQARRPVTLRFARVGSLLATVVGLRLVLAVTGVAIGQRSELWLIVLLGVLAVALWSGQRMWLLRGSSQESRERIQTACRGLFLAVEEKSPGRFQLSAQGQPVLGLRRITPGLQLLVLPRSARSGKVALLCSWLAKTYPGPVPRIRFVLKGGDL